MHDSQKPQEPKEDDTTSSAHADGSRSIAVGRDALGNVVVTGDQNQVQVTLVVADKRLLAAISASSTARAPLINPYRGLDAFYETDAAFFFGRRNLIRRAWLLFQGLQHSHGSPRILAVIGASGSGKSSLVRAGLLPELARSPMEELESPTVLILRPGSAPLSRLAEVVCRLPGAKDFTKLNLKTRGDSGEFDAVHQILASCRESDRSRFVVVVDQFEELFTECMDATARTAFLEQLAFAANHTDHLVSVVCTLRSDFAGAVRTPTAFASAVRKNPLRVLAMDRQELEEAIERPARQLGHPLPSALIESLVAQVEGRAGALPLLEFALKQLWVDHIAGNLDEEQSSSRLIEDFLVQAADALFETAGDTEQKRMVAQRIIYRAFVSMVQLGEGTPDTRRVARLSEFVCPEDDPKHVRTVLAAFTAPEARLVTASEQDDEPTYELAHEALITSWGRFASWLGNVPDKAESEQIRKDLRFFRRLFNAATEWAAGRGGLWTDVDLLPLANYLERKTPRLTTLQENFLQASRRRAWQLRWGLRMGVVAAVLVVIGAVALIRFSVVETANRETSLARDLALEARRVSTSELDRALLLSVESMQVRRGTTGLDVALEMLDKAHNLEKIIHMKGKIHALALDEIHQRIAVARDSAIEIWDAKTLAVQQRLPFQAARCLKFDPAGKHLAICGNLRSKEGFFLWRDTDEHLELVPLELPAEPNRSYKESPFNAAFTSDGKYVVAAYRDLGQVWDMETNQVVGNRLVVSPPNMSGPSWVTVNSRANLAAFVEDRQLTLVTLGSRPQVKQKIVFDVGLSKAEFSPKGDQLALGYDDGTVGFLPLSALPDNLDATRPLRAFDLPEGYTHYPGHSQRVSNLVFRSDSSVLISVGSDGDMLLWNASAHKQLSHPTENNCGSGSGFDPVFGRFYASDGNYEQNLPGPYAAPLLGTNRTERFADADVIWLPGGERVLSTSIDQRLNQWIYRGSGVLCAAHPRDVSFKKRIMAIGEHKTIKIADLDGHSPIKRLYVHEFVHEIKMDPDASLIIASAGDLLRVWNLQTLRDIGTPLSAHSFSLSGDGRHLAVLGLDQVVKFYDPKTLEEQGPPIVVKDLSIENIALSIDGERLAVFGNQEPLRILNVNSGSSVCVAPQNFSDLKQIYFGPPKRAFLTSHEDGILRLWSADNCEVRGVLNAESQLYDAAFSPDDQLLVTAGTNKRIRLWNVAEAEPVGPAMLQDSSVRRVAFNADTSAVELSAVHNSYFQLPITVEAVAEAACKIANRNLTQDEWRRSFVSPYRKTCPNLPDQDSQPLLEAPAKPKGRVREPLPTREIEKLAQQGLVEDAIRRAKTLRTAGVGPLPTAEEIRLIAFKSLYDDAQEHFEYERDDQAEHTLLEVEKLGEEGFDAKSEFRHWLARRALVEVDDYAKQGKREEALAALGKAIAADPEFVKRKGISPDSVEMQILEIQVVRAFKEERMVQAREKLQKARQLATMLRLDFEKDIQPKIVNECRDQIASAFRSNGKKGAIEQLQRMIQIFPHLSLAKELLVASAPNFETSKDMQKYIDKRFHKAFAVSDVGGWGWSSEYSTVQEAIKRALEECAKHGSNCYLYAVDNDAAPRRRAL